MKHNSILMAGIACGMFLSVTVLSATVPYAQPGAPRPVRAPLGLEIGVVLEEAGLPLTQEQLNQLAALRANAGNAPMPERILTDAQREALAAERRERVEIRGQAREDFRNRGAIPAENLNRRPQVRERELAHIAGVLEAAGVPLTAAQLGQLNEAERPFPGLNTVLTDEQRQALPAQIREVPRERTGRMRERLEVSFDTTAGRLAAVLEQAGTPLAPDQRAQLEALENGPGMMAQVQAILTDVQRQALRQAGPVLGHLRNGPRGMSPGGPKNPGAPEIIQDAAKPAGVDENPSAFTIMRQNFPNPFNPATTIEYSLASPQPVRVEIFTENGQRVATLVDQEQEAGIHSVVWDASGKANGVYLCRIAAGEYHATMKMLFVK